MGGLARRAGAMKEYRRNHAPIPVAILESGNALRQSDALDDPINPWILEALQAAGTQAMHTTVADWMRLNRMADLGKISKDVQTAFVSSSIEPSPDSRAPVKPYAIITARASDGGAVARIGVLGVSPKSEQSAKIGNALSAEDALKRYLPEVDRQSDIVVVMARMSDAELVRMARMFPLIDVILNGSATGEGRELQSVGDTRIVESSHGGIALGLLALDWDASGRITKSKNEIIPLHPMIKEDPAMLQVMEKAHKESVAFQEAEARKSPPPAMPSIFGGAKICRPCHEKASAAWEKSGHAHALATLKKTADQYNPACLECHVTGYGADRGFMNVIRTPDLVDVRCEACHGAALDHSKNPQGVHPGIGMLRDMKRKVRPDFCLRCHTTENSPNFKYESYWGKIAH